MTPDHDHTHPDLEQRIEGELLLRDQWIARAEQRILALEAFMKRDQDAVAAATRDIEASLQEEPALLSTAPASGGDEAERLEMHRRSGLLAKYHITKADGRPVDPGAEYFVLRLDDGGSDRAHVAACRAAVLTYAHRIAGHLPKLSADLIAKYSTEQKASGGDEAASAEQPSEVEGAVQWLQTIDQDDDDHQMLFLIRDHIAALRAELATAESARMKWREEAQLIGADRDALAKRLEEAERVIENAKAGGCTIRSAHAEAERDRLAKRLAEALRHSPTNYVHKQMFNQVTEERDRLSAQVEAIKAAFANGESPEDQAFELATGLIPESVVDQAKNVMANFNAEVQHRKSLAAQVEGLTRERDAHAADKVAIRDVLIGHGHGAHIGTAIKEAVAEVCRRLTSAEDQRDRALADLALANEVCAEKQTIIERFISGETELIARIVKADADLAAANEKCALAMEARKIEMDRREKAESDLTALAAEAERWKERAERAEKNWDVVYQTLLEKSRLIESARADADRLAGLLERAVVILAHRTPGHGVNPNDKLSVIQDIDAALAGRGGRKEGGE